MTTQIATVERYRRPMGQPGAIRNYTLDIVLIGDTKAYQNKLALTPAGIEVLNVSCWH